MLVSASLREEEEEVLNDLARPQMALRQVIPESAGEASLLSKEKDFNVSSCDSGPSIRHIDMGEREERY